MAMLEIKEKTKSSISVPYFLIIPKCLLGKPEEKP